MATGGQKTSRERGTLRRSNSPSKTPKNLGLRNGRDLKENSSSNAVLK